MLEYPGQAYDQIDQVWLMWHLVSRQEAGSDEQLGADQAVQSLQDEEQAQTVGIITQAAHAIGCIGSQQCANDYHWQACACNKIEIADLNKEL